MPHAAQTASAESHFFTDFNWTPDLGSNIGSREWWRGLGTCAALSVGAFFLWSGLSPVQAREVTRGASTLTQQVAKNLFLTPDQTLGRKVQEAILAIWLEQNFTKEEILEMKNLGFSGFLIGETLMRSGDIKAELKNLATENTERTEKID